MNWFEKMLDKVLSFFGAIGEFIMGIFSTVAEAVEGLTILPLVSLLCALCTLIINLICAIMSMFGSSVLNLFTLDIGTGGSTFELLFGNLGWVMQTFQILGMVLLVLICFASVFRMMTSPVPTGDSPFGLIAGAIISACLIYIGPTFIFFAQEFFGIFYNWILSWFSNDIANYDFSNFANVIDEVVTESIVASKQKDTLYALSLMVVLILLVGYQFVTYIYEVAVRYVILATLVITSPAAFALAASKSTRASFVKWLRMISSQFLLMIFNVIFLGLFYRAMNSFPTTYPQIANPGMTSLTTVFIWCLFLYACLYVGSKVDTYLCTLGLSVAECGAVLLTSLFADFYESGEMFIGKFSKMSERFSGRHSEHATQVGPSPMVNIINRMRGKGSAQTTQTLKADKALVRNERGQIELSSVNYAVANLAKGETIRSAEVGRIVHSSIRGIPESLLTNMNAYSCTIQNGCITISETKGTSARPLEISLIPVSFLEQEGIPVAGGRIAKLGKEEYLVTARGDEALRFNTYNPQLNRCMRDKCGEGNYAPVFVSVGGGKAVDSGIRRYYETDGNIVFLHEVAPTTCYRHGVELNPNYETIGRMQYSHIKVPVATAEIIAPANTQASVSTAASAANYSSRITRNASHLIDSPGPRLNMWQTDNLDSKQVYQQDDSKARNSWLADNFQMHPNSEVSECNVVQQYNIAREDAPAGIYVTQLSSPADRSYDYFMAPVLSAEPANGVEVVETVYANNGAIYTVVRKEKGTDGEPFVSREWNSDIPLAKDISAEAAEELTRVQSASSIQHEAMHRQSNFPRASSAPKMRGSKKSHENTYLSSKKKGGSNE